MASNPGGNVTLFRDLSPDDIYKYICGGDKRKTFLDIYNTRVKKLILAKDDRYLTIPETYETPVGICYRKNDKLYAMGVSKTTGVIDTHNFKVTVIVPIVYTLWGEYQRTPWTVDEITELLIWRCRLIKEPRRLLNTDVEIFEKSRWMMFVFWQESISELLRIETHLMDTLFEIDSRVGGSLSNRVGNAKERIEEQYKGTFSMNERELDLNERQCCFGKQISCMLKSIL